MFVLQLCACEFEILVLSAVTNLVCGFVSTAETNCPSRVSRINWAWNVFLS